MARRLKDSGAGAVTIHDVARHAGVSSMTVSRVINRTVNVREPLRQKVMASIKALDYTMNMAAHSTRAGMGGMRIGILYSNPSAAYLNEVMLGGLEQSSRLGVTLLLETCTGMRSQTRAVRRLFDQGVDGVILPPPLCDSETTVDMLARAGVPVLALATAQPLKAVSAVRIDDFRGALAMTRHLIRLGHRRIGFIKGDPYHTPTGQRYAGFLKGMEEAGLAVDDTLIQPGLFTFESGLRAAEALLKRNDRPTAIFASNDDMAAAVIALAHGLQIRIPGDISIAGFDDTPVASTMWPQITTIHQPIVAMGRAAVTTIFEKVREIRAGRTPQPRHLMMKCALIDRASTGPAAR